MGGEVAPAGELTSQARTGENARMAKAGKPAPVKLICGMIAGRGELFDEALRSLTEAFGPADIVSDVMDFDFTHYYDRQMGNPLYRRFAAFERLIEPDALTAAKLAANAIEERFSIQAAGSVPRPVNLDPGYVDQSKLVLASMKDFSHRVYLSQGVYAEVTLMYHKGDWTPLGWTFPDYASGRYGPFLTAARQALRRQLGKDKEAVR